MILSRGWVVNIWMRLALILAFCLLALIAGASSAWSADDPGKEVVVEEAVTTEIESSDPESVVEVDATGDAASTGPDEAAQLFAKKCAGCHTVGRGNLVGPDLVNSTRWPVPELEKNVQRMEKFVGGLTPEEVKSLVDFLKDPEVTSRMKTEEERETSVQVSDQPASAQIGQNLFAGKERFANKGIACIACHSVNGAGGSLGGDLTEVYDKLGEPALMAACENPSYPIMKAIYHDKPLSKQEALNLTKYFSSIKPDENARGNPPVLAYGLAGSLLFLGGLVVLYRNRNSGVHSKLKRR